MSFEVALFLIIGLTSLLVVIANDWTKRRATERAQRRSERPKKEYGPSQTDWKRVIFIVIGLLVGAWALANPDQAQGLASRVKGISSWPLLGSILGLFWFVPGLRLFRIGISQLRAALLARNWAIAQGRVVAGRLTESVTPSKKSAAGPKPELNFEVEYEYVVDGLPRRGTRLFIGDPLGFPITKQSGAQLADLLREGADVKVLYNPNNPSECGLVRLSLKPPILNFCFGLLLLSPFVLVGGYILLKWI
jgi:hypothetical protein